MNRSKEIYEHLGRVKDPEIPVLSLHDMGILRSVDVLDENDARFKGAMEPSKTLTQMPRKKTHVSSIKSPLARPM
jgi:metal-sulfur cluster biosynthetic enzyme